MTPTYVIDAAVAVKWGFPEPRSEAAVGLLGAGAVGRVTLLAPDLFLAELGALCRRKARAGEATPDEAAERLGMLLAAAPELVSTWELAPLAFELSIRHGRPFAEALHLALALREGCPYLTGDDRAVQTLAASLPIVRHLDDLGKA